MSIRLAEANRAIHAALAKAHNLAVNISVTVCDADGRLVAFQRMDGAFAEANRASIGKALASVSSGRPSGDESIEGPKYSNQRQQSLVKELHYFDDPVACRSFAGVR